MDLMYCMYSVHVSADFAKFIVSQALYNNDSLISFDVVSLFTIVSKDLAIHIDCQRLQNDPSLHFIKNNCHFQFTRILSKRYLLPLSFVVL